MTGQSYIPMLVEAGCPMVRLGTWLTVSRPRGFEALWNTEDEEIIACQT